MVPAVEISLLVYFIFCSSVHTSGAKKMRCCVQLPFLPSPQPTPQARETEKNAYYDMAQLIVLWTSSSIQSQPGVTRVFCLTELRGGWSCIAV